MFSSLGWIYGKVADLRNTLYDKGVFQSFDLGARTISVGNITTGGTGKTPLVAFIAQVLALRGEKVCILTRGYGRSDPNKRVLVSDGEHILAAARDAGDEPFELATKLLGKAIVIADADRVAAAEWAKRKFGVTVFVLDDAFQHRRARRDVDIVCIDATNPFGGEMFPAGRLREPLQNLKRADAIVITRADLAENLEKLKSEISKLNSEAPIFTSRATCNASVPLAVWGASRHPDEPSGRNGRAGRPPDSRRDDGVTGVGVTALAFCGIGNPASFFEMLRRDEYLLLSTEIFRDHHIYSQADIAKVEKRARESGAEILLTTAKDAVKLADLKFEIPCFVVEMEISIDEMQSFEELL